VGGGLKPPTFKNSIGGKEEGGGGEKGKKEEEERHCSSVVHHCLEKIFTPTLSSTEDVGTLFVTGVEVDVVATSGGNDVLVGESHRNPGRLLRLYRKDISAYL